jgi:hypothetical protein
MQERHVQRIQGGDGCNSLDREDRDRETEMDVTQKVHAVYSNPRREVVPFRMLSILLIQFMQKQSLLIK